MHTIQDGFSIIRPLAGGGISQTGMATSLDPARGAAFATVCSARRRHLAGQTPRPINLSDRFEETTAGGLLPLARLPSV